MARAPLHNGYKSTNDRSFYKRLAPLRWTFGILGSVAPNLTARIALRLFRTPFRHPTPKRERRWLDSADSLNFEVAGETLPGWSWGSGPTVLLVHGWEGRGSQMGAFAQPLVDAGFRVVTFDGPGHGASTGKLSSLPQFAEAIQVLANLVGPLHGIITHSFGGAASAWALRQGLEANRLVLVAPPADLDEYIGYFGDLLGFSNDVRRRMLERLEHRFDIRWDDVRQATLVPRSGTDLLVIHDHDDQDSGYINGSTVAAAWPGSRLHATSGLGHRRILRNPKVVAQVVEFLSATSTQATGSRTNRSAA
jgi:pimeloyl-ACP methyl ester carboxylesterase